ncbi:MAG: cupin domain-containing protein [Acidobacteriaceae bacterium]|jgi:quercetin dioxygenase-like cupin family protein|nr:cupin domain-containing protein [Acidobacteriaceae bacterium]
MNAARHLTSLACGFGLALLFAPSLIGFQQRGGAQAPAQAVVDKDHLRMNPEDGLKSMPVFGAQNAPGFYVLRNRFGPGQTSRPHYHDHDRWVTVIKGTWWTDEGDVFRPDKMIPIKEGGVMYHPAGFHHYDGAKDEEVIVQIMGMGPVTTVQTEVDANGKPVTQPQRP